MMSSNPVADWSVPQLSVVLLLLLVVAVGAIGWIVSNDDPLRRDGLEPSSALEWVREPDRAAAIVGAYHAHEGGVRVVLCGVLIDSFLFVPAYASFLAIACFWAARTLAAPWSTSGLILGWGAITAGALDLIENAGILVEVALKWSFAAPITNLACLAKWTLVGWSGLFSLGTLVMQLRRVLAALVG